MASSQLHPPVLDLTSPPASAPLASPKVEIDEMRGIYSRLRKRAGKNIKNHRNKSVTMTPSTYAKIRVIHTGLTSAQKNPYIKSVVTDELDGSVEFASSQDVLKGVLDTIETPTNHK